MTIFYGATDRKALVAALEELTGERRRYLGVPSCAYQVGNLLVTREGNLDDGGSGRAAELMGALAKKGFVAEPEADSGAEKPEDEDAAMEQEKPLQATSKEINEVKEEADEPSAETAKEEARELENEAPAETAQDAISGLDISVPADKVDTEKLARLLEAKGELIKKALGVEELHIEETDGVVRFPWFREAMDADRAQAYINFVSAICKMSMEQKRIQARDRGTVNEKYTFRCFLLRLGFIGKEFKQDRKILLERLSGSTAFRLGRKENEDDEVAE